MPRILKRDLERKIWELQLQLSQYQNVIHNLKSAIKDRHGLTAPLMRFEYPPILEGNEELLQITDFETLCKEIERLP